MQRTISRFGRYGAPAVCLLALGACFHPAPQEAAVPSGRYGGTVVAYPVGGYGYDPYIGYYGYGYAPYGSPYGYGYPAYVYLRPPVSVTPPVYRRRSGDGSVRVPGQYGLHPWNGNSREGQLRPPLNGMPVLPPTTGRIAHPRPVAPPPPRPTVNQKSGVSPRRIAVPRPAPRHQQRPERGH